MSRSISLSSKYLTHLSHSCRAGNFIGNSSRNWSVQSVRSTCHLQSKCVKTDTTSVAVAKNVFQTATFAKESFLTSKILLWIIWLLVRYIRARTVKMDVKRRSQWTTKINISRFFVPEQQKIIRRRLHLDRHSVRHIGSY